MKSLAGSRFCDVGLGMLTTQRGERTAPNGCHGLGILGVFRRRFDTGSWNANTGESIAAAIGSV